MGDGSQINIWNDCWILASHNLKVMTPRGHDLVTTVEELINPVAGNWDENLNRDLFWSVDVHRILQIPLVAGREDIVAWHFNKNGFFSVRSAYHLQWTHKFGGNLPCVWLEVFVGAGWDEPGIWAVWMEVSPRTETSHLAYSPQIP